PPATTGHSSSSESRWRPQSSSTRSSSAASSCPPCSNCSAGGRGPSPAGPTADPPAPQSNQSSSRPPQWTRPRDDLARRTHKAERLTRADPRASPSSGAGDARSLSRTRWRWPPHSYGRGRRPSICGRCPPKRAFWAYWDGTVMEQRGRKGWQTFGSLAGLKRLDLGRDRSHRLPPVAVWIAWEGGGARVGARRGALKNHRQ